MSPDEFRCKPRFHEAGCSTAARHRQLKERLDEELQQEARAEEVLKAKVRSWESTGQLEHSKHFGKGKMRSNFYVDATVDHLIGSALHSKLSHATVRYPRTSRGQHRASSRLAKSS